jgi:hypothetical protein
VSVSVLPLDVTSSALILVNLTFMKTITFMPSVYVNFVVVIFVDFCGSTNCIFCNVRWNWMLVGETVSIAKNI